MRYITLFFLIIITTNLISKELSKEYKKGIYLFNAQFYEDSLKYLSKIDEPFIKGVAYFRIESYKLAEEQFKKVNLKRYPFLKDEILYYLSNIDYETENYKDSYKKLIKISDNFVLKKSKDILLLKVLLKLKMWKDIEKIYKSYKKLKISTSSDMDIALALAEYLLNQNLLKIVKNGKKKGKKTKNYPEYKKAINLIKSVYIKNPGRDQILQISKLKKKFYTFFSLSKEEKVKKCTHLTILHQNKPANRCFDNFIDDLTYKKDKKLYCKAHFYNGYAYKKRRYHTSALKSFKKIMKYCPKFEDNDRLYYLAGSSSLSKKEYGDAINYFKKLYKVAPKSRLADDGINYVGFIYSLLKKYKKAEKIYKKQMKLFPNGDTTEEAIWKMGFNLYKQKKYKKYINFYYETIKNGVKERSYSSKGRLKYWLGRSYDNLKQYKKAQNIYKEVIEEFNNNYYTFLARMRYKNSKNFKKIGETDPVSKDKLYEVFKQYKVFDKITYYASKNLTEFLIYELNALNKKSDIYKKYKKELLYFLIESKSYHIPFWNLRKSRYKWIGYDLPYHKNKNLLKYLYPKAYYEFISPLAKKRDISPYLILSIMREESYFHPSIESWANAYGLMQIIEPTAKNLARILKIGYTREELFNPEYNIKLGSKYLSLNSKLFKNRLYQVIPSYNAGENAVKRWNKKFKKLPFDQYVEEIPIKETRHYTKRVLNTYFLYNLLYENRFVTIK